MIVTEGVAQKIGPCSVTIDCPVDGNVREALCGEITTADGSVWDVPGPITDGATLVDVYNECTLGGDNPDFESELSTIVVDDDGTELTAHLFGDNYFELYANGRFIGRDAVGFTPFNAHAARYRVSYPITYAALLVDWEGYLGIGLEDTRNRFHIGDGGFIASFSDGAKNRPRMEVQSVLHLAPRRCELHRGGRCRKLRLFRLSEQRRHRGLHRFGSDEHVPGCAFRAPE